MDGRNRTFIYRGLRVAIVLKEDQPTGKRTLGEVGQVLTPGDFHPHGIKVRLKDGQVGRVQEILGRAPAAVGAKYEGKDIKREVEGVSLLIVLAVRKADGAHWGRKLRLESGEMVLTLGLDVPARAGQELKSLGGIVVCVSGRESAPRLVISQDLVLGERRVAFRGYECHGTAVNDPQEKLWTWAGWITEEELRREAGAGALSEESEILFRALLGV